MEDSLSTSFDADKLNSFKKVELINIIKELQNEKTALKSKCDNFSGIEQRVVELERSHYLYLQYGRRNSVEISGIPGDVATKDLESHVINIYKEAKVEVAGRKLEHFDIEACHRIGKRGVVIARFVNRKFANEGLYKGKNLKGNKIYTKSGETSPIYINNSFCVPFQYIGYVVRKLKKRELIEEYKIKNGVFQIKKVSSDNFVEISHKCDFEKYNLDVATALAE